jgi:hypothetical protein
MTDTPSDKVDDFKSDKPVDINTDQVAAIIVTDGHGRRYSWNLGHSHEVDEKLYGHIDGIIFKLCVGENTGRGPDRWWLVANVDCFSPPLALIQANSIEEALEIFDDKCESWVKVEEGDIKDYINEGKSPNEYDYYSEQLSWNCNGTPIDTEQVQAWECSEVQLIVRR